MSELHIETVMSSHWLEAAIGKPAVKIVRRFVFKVYMWDRNTNNLNSVKRQDKFFWYLRYSKLQSLDVAVYHIEAFQANWY